MTNGFGVIVEMLVAILLALTIIYCISLNRRLKLLKADEQSLRATISELVTATEIAERAIAGLKFTVQDCEAGLGERLRSADRFTADLDRSIASGEELFDRLARIVVAGGGTLPAGTGRPHRRAAGRSGGFAARRPGGCRRGASFCRTAARQGVWSCGMIGYFRDLRLLPIAMVASACLLALVAADLLLGRASLSFDNSAKLPTRRCPRRPPVLCGPPIANSRGRSRCSTFPIRRRHPRTVTTYRFFPSIPPLATGPQQRRHYYRLGAGAERREQREGRKARGPQRQGSWQQRSRQQGRRRQTAEGSAAVAQRHGDPINAGPNPGPSAAERAILERLQERRPGARKACPRARHPRRPYCRRGEAGRIEAHAKSRRAKSKSRPPCRKRTRPKPPASRA